MNWKRIILFALLELAITVIVSTTYTIVGLYDPQRYTSYLAMCVVFYAPVVLITFVFYWWFAKGLEKLHYPQALVVFLSVPALVFCANYAVFDSAMIDKYVVIEQVLAFVFMVLGVYFGVRASKQRITSNA